MSPNLGFTGLNGILAAALDVDVDVDDTPVTVVAPAVVLPAGAAPAVVPPLVAAPAVVPPPVVAPAVVPPPDPTAPDVVLVEVDPNPAVPAVALGEVGAPEPDVELCEAGLLDVGVPGGVCSVMMLAPGSCYSFGSPCATVFGSLKASNRFNMI